MPTKMPRVTFAISQEELSRVEAFQKEHNIKNQSQAVIQLIRMGFDDISHDVDMITPSEQSPEQSLMDDLETFVHKLKPEQAVLMVKIIERALAMKPETYAYVCKETRDLWKG